jgi:hypothetical protein
VLATFLFALVAPSTNWANTVLVVALTATLGCARWTSGMSPRHPRRDAAIGTAALGVAVLNIVPGGSVLNGATALFAGGLTIAAGVAIGIGVVDQGEPNSDSVRGAIAIYVLLGILFAFFYSAIALLGHGPFFTQGTDGTRALRTYFSYVTLATLGYGDYSAASTLGHTVSVVEALLGQLYLVTVVTVLVSRLGRRQPVDDGDGGQPLIPPG